MKDEEVGPLLDRMQAAIAEMKDTWEKSQALRIDSLSKIEGGVVKLNRAILVGKMGGRSHGTQ